MSPKDNLYVAVDSIPGVVTTIKVSCLFILYQVCL